MRNLRFKKIDAFASKLSAGNPAAAVYLDSADDLTPNEMLKLANELKGFVSEVGYVYPGTNCDFQLRYFSSEREVAFCGHATIAILNDIVANNEEMQKKETLTIATNNDKLMVENRYLSEKSVYISAPKARFTSKAIKTKDLALALNCVASDIDQRLPLQIVNGGLETLVVPMSGLEATLSASPNLLTINRFCKQIGVDIIILYCSETVTAESKYRTRVFAPTFGYLEDPATGSGNAALGYYLLKIGEWDGNTMQIEQNAFRDTPNFVKIYAKGIDIDNCHVWFGGGAMLKVDGNYVFD